MFKRPKTNFLQSIVPQSKKLSKCPTVEDLKLFKKTSSLGSKLDSVSTR